MFGKKKKTVCVPADADGEALLKFACEEQDPVLKEKALLLAREKMPSDLRVEEELLFLGELAQRKQRIGDFRVIKCYLLHVYEHPETYSQSEHEKTVRELFDHPQLRKCLSLSEDPEAFLKKYLLKLSKGYYRLFVEGTASHVPSLFGYSTQTAKHNGYSHVSGQMLRNILLEPALNEDERILLSQTFYRVCADALGDDVAMMTELEGVRDRFVPV